MNNAELIKALRHCTDDSTELCVDDKYQRPMWYGYEKDLCKSKLMSKAADLIEAQQKRIAELEESNKMLKNTIDADKGVMLDRIRFLEAQLSKEGEWRDDNGAVVPLDDYGYTTDLCQCSVCGDWLIASDEYHVRGRYCPNCGAKMKGEQE